MLRKAFRDVDLDNDGVISFPEWARVVEVAGSVLTDQESEFLFYFVSRATALTPAAALRGRI